MKVYRIKSGDCWYEGRQDFGKEEALSPLFANTANCEKKIRAAKRICLDYLDRDMSDDYRSHWRELQALWYSAEVVAYDLVRVS